MNKRFYDFFEKTIKINLLGLDIGNYKIVVGAGDVDNYSPGETPLRIEKAAKELQKYIYMLTGKILPLMLDSYHTVSEREIIVGKTKRKADYYNDKSSDGYIIKSFGSRLVIDGGLRGVLYGVYSFLEDYLGVRYLTPLVEKFVYNGNITIKEIDEKFIPRLEYRDIMWHNAWDKSFSVKQKINGTFVRKLGEEEGYGVGYAGGFEGICHTFWPLVPKNKYFNEHPEYYALVDGKRNPDGLCMTNEGTFNTFLENLKKWLRAEKDPRLVSVSANDNGLYCRCEKCAAIDEREESHAGQVLYFVNKIADAIKDEFPNVRVDTLSYSFTRKAPKYLKPKENVAIRVCTGISCFNHKIGECKEPVAVWNGVKGFNTDNFVRDIKKWSAVSDSIYIWDYIIDYFKPNAIFPNFHTLVPNMHFYLENNAKGIYYEGTAENGEFCELRAYLLAKLAWEPEMTQERFYTLMDEFLEGYYGNGWVYIKEFIDYSKEYLKDCHFGGFTPLQYIYPYEIIDGKRVYSVKFFEKCRELFERAKAVSKKESEKDRIDRSEIQVDFTDLFLNMDYYVSVADEKQKIAIYERNKNLYLKFRKYGVVRIIDNCELPEITDFTIPPCRWSEDDEDAAKHYVGIL